MKPCKDFYGGNGHFQDEMNKTPAQIRQLYSEIAGVLHESE